MSELNDIEQQINARYDLADRMALAEATNTALEAENAELRQALQNLLFAAIRSNCDTYYMNIAARLLEKK